MKRQFASDLLNITLAAPNLNRYEKIAKDAAEWLPSQNQCWFADRVVSVRRKYRLTIDRAEAVTLETVLPDCASSAMVFLERGAATLASHLACSIWTHLDNVQIVLIRPRRNQAQPRVDRYRVTFGRSP